MADKHINMAPSDQGREMEPVLKARYRGLIPKIAHELGISESTSYDYACGRIKMSPAYIAAAIRLSGGDPDFKKYLEPDGYRLLPVARAEPDKKTLAEELCDDIPALAEYHEACRRAAAGKATKSEVRIYKDKIISELDQNEARLFGNKKRI